MAAANGSGRELLMVSLSRFYSVRGHMQRVLPLIATGEGGEGGDAPEAPQAPAPVSLRLLDWFVTNYAKAHNVVLTRQTQQNNVVHFNVYLSYRAQLKAYSKQMFDPFRRRDRIVFFYERGRSIETTIGQLNFFRWMLQNDLIEYVTQHARAIEADMLAAQRQAKADAAAEAAAATGAGRAAAEAAAEAEARSGGKKPAGGRARERERERLGEGGGADACPGAAKKGKKKKDAPPPGACRATTAMMRLVGTRTVSFD